MGLLDDVATGGGMGFAMLPKAYFPGCIVAKPGAITCLQALKEKTNLVVISKSVYGNATHMEWIGKSLANCSNEFWAVSGEPTHARLDDLKERLASKKFDNVIGIGGGSAMDLAKCAKTIAEVGLCLVPTTFGTGAECSQYAVLLNKGKKEVVRGHALLPELVIFDPPLLSSLPEKVLAYSAADALGHALEAAVSKMRSPASDAFAREGFRGIFEVLGGETASGAGIAPNVGELARLQWAGFHAGMAQSVASTGLAHGLAHAVGARFGIGHAHAVALFLPAVLRFNAGKGDSYEGLGLHGVEGHSVAEKVGALFARLGIPVKPAVSLEDALECVAEAKADVCTRTNPCPATETEIMQVIRESFEAAK